MRTAAGETAPQRVLKAAPKRLWEGQYTDLVKGEFNAPSAYFTRRKKVIM